mgnify:CR=1 FL=1
MSHHSRVRPEPNEDVAKRPQCIVHYGSIIFPTSASAMPSKFLRIRLAGARDELAAEMVSAAHLPLVWGLELPSVLISVVDGGDELPKAITNTLRQGLHEVVVASSAWVTTSGLQTPVNAAVGQALGTLKDSVVIGIAPWNAIGDEQRLCVEAIPDGYKDVYHGTVGTSDGKSADLEIHHTHHFLIETDNRQGAQMWNATYDLRGVRLEEPLSAASLRAI